MRDNIIRNSAQGIGITAKDPGVAQLGHDVLITQTLFENISTAPFGNTGSEMVYTIMNNEADITIQNNTVLTFGKMRSFLLFTTSSGQPPAGTNVVFDNNIVPLGGWGINADTGPGVESSFFAEVAGTATYSNIVAIGTSPNVNPSKWPKTQFVSDIQAALNTGKGANIAAVRTATNGAVSGNWGACTPRTTCPAQYNCGTYTDGCSGSITCGTCTNGQLCGGNVCYTPDTAAPSIVNTISAAAQSAYLVTVQWTGATDNTAVAGYNIYRDGVLKATISGTGTTYSDTSTAATTTYQYTVAAFDAAGNTAQQGASASVTTPTAPLAGSLPTGIVVKYDFTNGLATDSSGNNLNGVVNGPVQTTGKAGDGLIFDGINDYVALANPAQLQNLGPVTITAWINPRAMGGVIIGKRDGTCAGYWSLMLLTGGPNYLNARAHTMPSTLGVPLNSWSHVAITWDGTTNSGSEKIYVNGVDKSGTETLGKAPGTTDTACKMIIGARTPSAEFYNGSIDEIHIYNRVLGASEIIQDYNAAQGLPTTCTPESDTTFCSRLLATCGTKTGSDNCGNARTVTNCGTCLTGYTCTANTCVQNTANPADRNGDGIVNVQDIVVVVSDIKTQNLLGDINKDSVVDIRDLVRVVHAIGN